jgi:hypothetical protein
MSQPGNLVSGLPPVGEEIGPDILERYTQEGQNPVLVREILYKIRRLIMPSENVVGIFIQLKPVLNSAAIVTNERLIFHRPTIYGGAYIEEYWWRVLVNARIEEGIIEATFRMDLRRESGLLNEGPVTIGITWLPRGQARKLYAVAKEMDLWWNDEWRRRHLEEVNAATGGFGLKSLGQMIAKPLYRKDNPKLPEFSNEPAKQIIQDALERAGVPELPVLPIEKKDEPPAILPTQAPIQSVIKEEQLTDPTEKLRQLKELLDSNLISPQEYQTRKAAILSEI